MSAFFLLLWRAIAPRRLSRVPTCTWVRRRVPEASHWWSMTEDSCATQLLPMRRHVLFCSVAGHWYEIPGARRGKNRSDQDAPTDQPKRRWRVGEDCQGRETRTSTSTSWNRASQGTATVGSDKKVNLAVTRRRSCLKRR